MDLGRSGPLEGGFRRVRSHLPTGPRGPLFCCPTIDLKQSELLILSKVLYLKKQITFED